jgi:hypothetical protein
MTNEDPRRALDNPEGYLWIYRADDLLTIIDAGRLHELHNGASPESTTERLLVNHREWLRVLVTYALGEGVVEIPEAGPLPEWNETWLMSWEGKGDRQSHELGVRWLNPAT